MGDLISRQAAIDAVYKIVERNLDSSVFKDDLAENPHIDVIVDELENLPSAEPERKTGKWHILDECANEGVYCSECRKKVFKIDFSNTMKWKNFRYCPNCGSYMGGIEIEDE